MRKVTVPTIITNGHFNKKKTLSELKRCHADRIALAMDRELEYEFSSPENLKLLSELIEYYEANGIETMVWVGECIGHSGGPAKENPPYTPIRVAELGDTQPFCVMDERFVAAVCKWIKNIASCGAKMIMLDDMRYNYNRGTEKLACCCPLHMAALRKELGEEITEEELHRKIFCGGKNKYRDAWLKVQGDGMRNFARRLREALDEVNPDARLSFCCAPVSWDQEGYDAIELAEIMAGDTEPFIRTTGAPYWVTGWYYAQGGAKLLGEAVELERMQIDWLKDSGIEIMTEGDTYPRPRIEAPAAHLECFDMALCASDPGVGMLKYMLDYVADADYETGYIDAMIQNQKNYEWIEKHFSGKKCVGLNPYNKMRKAENTQVHFDDFESIAAFNNALCAPMCRFAALNTLPTAYGGDGVKIVFGENGRYIGEEELNNGAIIDITAAKYLTERGIDVGISGFGDKIGAVQKGFTDTINYHFVKSDIYTRIHFPVKRVSAVISDKADVVIEFAQGKNSTPACYLYENKKNQRFMVMNFDAMHEQANQGAFGSYALRRLINEKLEWLGRKPMHVIFDTDAPQGYMVVKEDEKSVTVGFWNMYADKIHNAKFKIGVSYKNVSFFGCEGHAEGEEIMLDTVVYPYEFVAFELEL